MEIVADQELFFLGNDTNEFEQPQKTKKTAISLISKMTLNAKRAAHFLVHFFAIIARLTLLNLISIICDRRFNL